MVFVPIVAQAYHKSGEAAIIIHYSSAQATSTFIIHSKIRSYLMNNEL